MNAPRRSSARRGPVRAAAAALALTGAVTATALLPGEVSTTTAAVLYVLAVVGASVVGGRAAGIAASFLSFLALNFFFTPPLHTLSVGKAEDLVALVAFLIVSVVVGTLLSRAVTHGSRAERRERESRLLQHLGTRLLSGDPVHEVLGTFGRAVTELLGLVRCEIRTELGSEPVVVEGPPGPAGEVEVIPIIAQGREVGGIVAVPPAGRALDREERSVIAAFAGQMGLAIEGMRLSREATEARVDAEASRSRAALFSSVTHDLRTPLASVTASVTSLLERDATFTPEERRELLETIREEAERLNRLVGNLLDLSRIRAGALTPAKVPSDVDEIVEGVVGRLQSLLQAHEIRLVLRDNVPSVPVDVVQIDQVLTNLLENAVKFSPPGTRITVSTARRHDVVEVCVADEGRGIPAAERERVTEPFVRGETDGRTGAGLGLSIAKAIVEAHGGRLEIAGTPGGGTSVTFGLPMR